MTLSLEEAKQIGTDIGIDWDAVDFSPESFLAGLEVELEHGTELGEEVNVTNDSRLLRSFGRDGEEVRERKGRRGF